LSAAQLTHHDESLPSIDVFQDTEQSARRQTFSTQSFSVRSYVGPNAEWRLGVGRTRSLTVRSAIRRRRFAIGSKVTCSRRTGGYRRASAMAELRE
ncbi:hypothetical protein, partial [Paraburkholderia fynbosensis]|uniref:hypothetical protein n=1 Tax=Paraburkholderia fynbosensis TaxID=1200993 RepID=UPI001C2E3A09